MAARTVNADGEPAARSQYPDTEIYPLLKDDRAKNLTLSHVHPVGVAFTHSDHTLEWSLGH